ncbi:MAG: hypothetical protein V4696_10415 [Pseudomonadota bacterium]
MKFALKLTAYLAACLLVLWSSGAPIGMSSLILGLVLGWAGGAMFPELGG